MCKFDKNIKSNKKKLSFIFFFKKTDSTPIPSYQYY